MFRAARGRQILRLTLVELGHNRENTKQIEMLPLFC